MGPSREIGSDWPSQAFPGDRKPNLAGSSQATASKRVREGALPAENRPSPGRTRGSCVSAAPDNQPLTVDHIEGKLAVIAFFVVQLVPSKLDEGSMAWGLPRAVVLFWTCVEA